MMCSTVLIGALIFIIGEFVSNLTIFRYIKNYFEKKDRTENSHNEMQKNKGTDFLFMEIATFKGVLERFVLFVALLCNFTPILVVFGALKLGTRLDHNNPVGNDYFHVGNFTSILVAIVYTVVYNKLIAAILVPGIR